MRGCQGKFSHALSLTKEKWRCISRIQGLRGAFITMLRHCCSGHFSFDENVDPLLDLTRSSSKQKQDQRVYSYPMGNQLRVLMCYFGVHITESVSFNMRKTLRFLSAALLQFDALSSRFVRSNQSISIGASAFDR